MNALREFSKTRLLLYATTVIFGFTAIAHQINHGHVMSYLFGDVATQVGFLVFCVFIGGGVGWFIATHVTLSPSRRMHAFLWAEILLTITAGLSTAITFWAYAEMEESAGLIRGILISIAILVGIEDGLLFGFIATHESTPEKASGKMMLLGHFGSAIAAYVVGPFLIPNLGGPFGVAVLLGIVDGLVVLANVLWFAPKHIRAWPVYAVIAAVTIAGLTYTYDQRLSFSLRLTENLYEDPIVKTWESPYGSIVLTKDSSGHRLYIGGNLQFASYDEAQYHEPLVSPALSLAQRRVVNRSLRVLIAGGGDGLATRNVLRCSCVEEVVVVDIDTIMTHDVAQTQPISDYNDHAFDDPRVTIVNTDAYIFLRDDTQLYDVIIVDLVDPSIETIAKLYSREFYEIAKNRLTYDGVFVTQSTSPYYASRAFWTIHATLTDVFPTVVPYRWAVPSFGDWGWNIASPVAFDPQEILIDESLTRWMTQDGWSAMQFFGKDELVTRDLILERGTRNTLVQPIIVHLYNNDNKWDQWGP